MSASLLSYAEFGSELGLQHNDAHTIEINP